MTETRPHHSTTNPHAEEEHGVGHIVPPGVLITTGVVLLILTVITVLAASIDFARLDMPDMNIWIALGIAALKGSLVCLFFMHLKYDRPFHGFVMVTSLAFVALFIAFAMTDTFEYREDVIPGDTEKVRAKLAELESAE